MPLNTSRMPNNINLSSILERSVINVPDQARQNEQLRNKISELEGCVVDLQQMDLLKLNKFINEFIRKARMDNRFTEKPSNPLGGSFSCLIVRRDQSVELFKKVNKEDVGKFIQSKSHEIRNIVLSNINDM